MRSQYRRGRCPVRSHEVRRGQSAEKEEVQLQLDHRGQTRSQYSIGRGPAWSHEVRKGHSTVYEEVQSGHTGQTRYNCRGDGVPAPWDHKRQTRSQYRRGRCPVRSHEVRRGQSAEKEKVQLHLDHRGQTRSQYSMGRGPAWSHEVRQGHSTVYEEVQSGHRGQTRYNVEETEFQLPRITEDRRGHSTEEGGVQSGHTRSGDVRVQSRRRSSSSWITEDR